MCTFIHRYICIWLRVLCCVCFTCFMSPWLGMARDNWTVAWYSFTHVNTLQVCMAQVIIFPDFYPRTELYSVPFLRSFIQFYFLSQATDIFLLLIANVYSYVCIFISCMPTVILLYWLILWFTIRSELTSIKDQSMCNGERASNEIVQDVSKFFCT